MSVPTWMSGPPKKILFATDLSARCDRALDRSAALAAQWQSALVVLHVLEDFEAEALGIATVPSWRRTSNPVDLAWKELHADVSEVSDRARVLISKGNPADVILTTAEQEGCDLIVIGIARDELLGRFSLGGTVDRLLRRTGVPLLVVKNRPRTPYQHIVVATDFSPSARHALEAAARLFPGQPLTLFHAFDSPMAGLMTDAATFMKDRRAAAERELHLFLETVDKPETWQAPNVLIEHGAADGLLRNYVRDKQADLVVLGTQGRSAIAEVLVGSVAKMIMNEVPCDALIIREPVAASER